MTKSRQPCREQGIGGGGGKSREDSSVRYKGGDVWPSSRTRKKASVVQVCWARGRMTLDEAGRAQSLHQYYCEQMTYNTLCTLVIAIKALSLTQTGQEKYPLRGPENGR